MEKITVWTAHGDGGEYGVGPVIAHFSTQQAAINAAKGKGWYGGNGVVLDCQALRVDGDVWLLAQANPIDLDAVKANQDAKLLADTLAALSDEQKRVLGIFK